MIFEHLLAFLGNFVEFFFFFFFLSKSIVRTFLMIFGQFWGICENLWK